LYVYGFSGFINLIKFLPASVNHFFLGVNLTEKNLWFALVAAVSQYILGAIMFKTKTGKELEAETEMIRAMNMQMKYFLPIVIGVVSYITPSVISLYLIVTNIFGIVQEIIIKKPLEMKIKQELSK
jgi:membrane protein insertase Oxa1/YidC/SpoIIIJ